MQLTQRKGGKACRCKKSNHSANMEVDQSKQCINWTIEAQLNWPIVMKVRVMDERTPRVSLPGSPHAVKHIAFTRSLSNRQHLETWSPMLYYIIKHTLICTWTWNVSETTCILIKHSSSCTWTWKCLQDNMCFNDILFSNGSNWALWLVSVIRKPLSWTMFQAHTQCHVHWDIA